MERRRLDNISNSDAYGVEWTGQSGNRYQLFNPRGTTALIFGTRSRVHKRWNLVPVAHPLRFMRSAPATHQDFVTIARAVIAD